MKSIWNRILSLRYISMPLFLIRPTNENYEITHERKFWTHEIRTEKIWNPQNTHEKIFKSHKIHTWKKFSSHEIPSKAGWHHGTRPTRPTMARDPRNLAHSFKSYISTKNYAVTLYTVSSKTWDFFCLIIYIIPLNYLRTHCILEGCLFKYLLP